MMVEKLRAHLLLVGFCLISGTLPLLAQGSIGIAKTATVSGRDVTMNFYIENLGVDDLTAVTFDDDLDAVFGAGNYTVTDGPNLIAGPGTMTPNGAFDGTTDTTVLTAGSLLFEESAQISIVVSVDTPVDLGSGLGVYSNQVTISATDQTPAVVNDLSDSGTDPDPNGNGDAGDAGEDDPTGISLFENPSIGVAKRASLSGTQVTLDFFLENFGNVALSNLSLTDDLDATFGAGNYTVLTGPDLVDDPGTITVNAGFDGSADNELITSGTLALADTASIQIVVDVTNIVDLGDGVGVFSNQATAYGEAPVAATDTDLSTNGSDPDPNGDDNPSGVNEDTPTPIVMGEEPVIGVAKDAAVAGSVITLDFYLENLGNVALSNLSLVDDFNTAFGAGNWFISAGPTFIDDPGTITFNGGFDGNFDTEMFDNTSTLAIGDTAQIQLEITILTIADLGSGNGVYSNQATAYGEAPGGGTFTDLSDDGTDPDPNGNGDPRDAGEDDPTAITVAEIASIGIAKQFIYRGLIGGVFVDMGVRFTVTNYGNQTISNISITEDLNAVYGAGNFNHVTDPTYLSGPGTFNYNTSFNGSSNTAMLNGGSSLAPGETEVFEITHWITNLTDQGNGGVGLYENQVTLLGTDPDANPVSDVSHDGTDPDGNGDGDPSNDMDVSAVDANVTLALGVAKDVSIAGNIVTFDFFVENLGSENLESISLIENLDAVFGSGNYVVISRTFIDDPGTLTLDSSFNGSDELDMFDPVNSTFAAGDTAQVQMVIFVTTVANQGLGLGNYTNQVTVSGLAGGSVLVDDTSDFGTDPDPNGDGNPDEAGENDATTFSLAADSPVGIAKTAGIAGFNVTIDLYLENHGPDTVTSVTVEDVLDDAFGAGNYTIVTPPAFIDDPGTLNLNGAYDGSTDTAILDAGSTLVGFDTAQIQMVVSVDTESDQGSGYGVYSNQASVRATQPSGVVLSDLSDDGTDPDPNGNDDPGEAGEDDPTAVVIAGNPAIGLAQKTTVSGTLVTYDLYVENLGDVTLTNILLQQGLNGVYGSSNYTVTSQPTLVSGPGTILRSTQYFGSSVFTFILVGGSLRPGEVEHVRYQVNVTNVTDQGNGVGIFHSSQDISSTGPDGTPANDTSDDGTDPDPNGNGNAGDAGEDDLTIITIGDEANIGVAKNVSATGTAVTFDFYLENFGGSTMSGLTLPDDLDAVFGAGNYTIATPPNFVDDPGTINLNGGFDGSADTAIIDAGSTLAALDTAQIQMVVNVTNITDQGLGLGNYSNQVTISGSAPLGTLGSDLSDFGTDPDPDGNGFANDDGEGDATTFSVDNKVIGVAKTATVNGREVTFDFYVENLGNVAITSVSLPEDLDAVFGAGNYTITSPPTIVSAPREFVPNADYDGSTDTELIASGGINLGVTEQIQMVVFVDALIDPGGGLGVYDNQVTVDGDGITDLSDDGTDPDPDGNGAPDDAGEDDATSFTIAEDASIALAKDDSVSGNQVTLDFYLENVGNVDASNLALSDDLDTVFGAGTYSINSGPSFIDDPGTITLNAAFDGSADIELITSGTLSNGDTAQIRVVVDLDVLTDQGSGFGVYSNQALVSSDSPDASSFSDFSDDGVDGDSDDDGFPDGPDEDDPTDITVTSATVGDFVWDDLNGDGVQDGGEPGISGVTVFADFNSNGTQDGVEPGDTTDGSGAYDIEGLVAGTYDITVDTTTVPSGYVLTGNTNPDTLTVNTGDDIDDADFGYQQQDATIGDFVWTDLDGDGVQDGGEPGISGVTVYLDLNSNGSLDGGEPSTTTDGSGAYDFTGLATGTYDVTVDETTVTAGFVLTGGTNPQTVNLAAGEDYNDADFGYQQQDASIGDFVWNDLNGDGVQDGGESGISGVTVYLDLNSNGSLDGGEPSATTDGSGAYDFTNLATGTYDVTVDETTVTAGFVLTGGTNPDTVNLAAGEDYNDADFGYQQQDASIGDFVWEDVNGDGVQDGGEPGLSGVTVYLDLNSNGSLDGGEPNTTTDGSGNYDFTNLATGTYDVTVDETTVPTGVVLTGGTNPDTVNLAAGEDYNDADFGYQYQDASIGDFVWEDENGDGVQDGGEPGISGVTVYLDLNSNGALDGGEPSQATDGSGAYDFTGLPEGTYDVAIDGTTVPSGLVLTGGTDPHSVNLTKSEDYNDADFGYQYQDASIGDFVWNDLNGDGVQDGGEPGLSGVTVYLDTNSNGSLDGGEPSVATDASGAYDFTGLTEGSYDVTVDESTIATGFVRTGGANPQTVNLSKSEDYNAADFGYQQQDASIGDLVWEDLDGDGVQDGGEPGFSGVTVFLDSNSNGTLDGGETSTSTDASGAYDFTNLATGTYPVTVDESTLPTGVVLTGGTNPHTVNLAAGEDYNDADFGYQYQNASIGDFVWEDLDGDGVQDGGEPGLSGVTVFLDANANGTLDGGESSQATDGSGAYDFTGLPEGTYSVAIDDATLPTGVAITGGTDPQSVNLGKSEDYNDADFGYQYQDGSIGDFVWNDLNGDGVQDGGEPGISGVTVFLDLNSNGTLDGGEPSATTDAAGAYDITNLATGTYDVTVDTTTVTTGFVLTGGTNPASVSLSKSEDYNTADFGYQQQDATIGDFVWEDENGDGVQDAGEAGISGATVFLDLNSNGAIDGGEPTDTTDAAGAYDFTDLATGTYSVRVDETTLASGLVLTGGTNPASVNLAAGEDYNDADFGYQFQNASIGDFVWEDLNGDGVQDGGEPGIAGVTVFLDTNANGTLDGGESSQATDAAGAYDFTGLPEGTYNVAIDDATLPTGVVLTSGTDPTVVNLAKSEDHNDADFGYQYQDASIGDFVWTDLNGDGVQDAGENGIAGVTVYLDLNSNGAIDGGEPTETTDAAGAYDFTNLAAGTYAVTVDETTVTTGFVLTGGTNPLSVTLAKSEDHNDADFGYQQQDATIGDFVWEDVNGDGVQDAGEPGLAGVTVFIDANSNGTLDGGEPTETTDAAGAYDFTDLATGTYSVRVDETTLPSGMVITGGTNPASINLAAGEDNNDADFGYQYQNATIGDFVWEDLNGDGVQDAGEPGIAGITVFLDTNANGTVDGGETTQVTDAAGAYDFTGLPEGTYTVAVDDTTVPSGLALTGGTDPVVVNLAKSEDHNDADFGYQYQDASIGDFVWNDLNGDGVQDGGEPGIAGYTVFLDTNANGTLDAGESSEVTDASGAYDFTGLTEGTYTVAVDTSTVTTGFVLTGGTNPVVVNLGKSEDHNDADFGYQQQDATIGDRIWNDFNADGVQDAGEPGLANATVILDLNNNGSADAGEPTQVTDADGAYDFTDLATGTYYVLLDETTISPTAVLTGGTNPTVVNLAAGEDQNDADIGYQVQDATLGDFVWDDLNGDGVQDAGEPGLAGVTVYADLNNNATLDAGEPNDTSDAAGAYDLTNLPPGTYTIRNVTTTVPEGYFLTTGIPPLTYTLASSEDYNDADFGYRQSDATIGDFIWNDLNGDGVQDPGEPGLASVTLYADLDGDLIQDPGEPARTTDADGFYEMTGIAEGTYTIVVDTPPVGFESTTTHPLIVTVTAGEEYVDADFGYIQADGVIGDLVWSDSNGDGIKDANEFGIAGVTLEIHEDPDASGTRDAGEGKMGETITNSLGFYQFTGLEAGTYVITVTDDKGILTNYTLTGGTNPMAITVVEGENYMDADFGYQLSDSAIGDLVFEDINSNGVRDAGEPGIAGVTIDLIDDTNGNGVADAGEPVAGTQTTDANGAYNFTDLAAGKYVVVVTDTGGVLADAVLTTANMPYPVDLGQSQTVDSADFGYCLEPVITEQPEDLIVCHGDEASLSVTATGSSLTYQWRKDGDDIPGATSPEFFLSFATPDDSGFYDVVVTGACGSTTSATAELEVSVLDVYFDPEVVVQGVDPVTLEAIIECVVDPSILGWKAINGELEEFGVNENPVTLPIILTETTTFSITVIDALNPTVSAEVEVTVLTAQNPDFLDLNGDGCNTIEDVEDLAPDWRSHMNDANGDDFIDVRDFIYIRVDEDCNP